ncbi:molybdopterin oxidoreductase [Lachnospiraceae bacterium TWA4]|nr:molybdopterin oxidoreductase [Lachnospiraceae bacterium TWA4]
MAAEWKKTSCYNCGVCCGLEVQIENNEVVSVRPDKESMRSLGGYCCRKGRALKYFQHNKNRLNYPLKRVGDEFVQISWEQALSEIGEKVKEIREKYTPKAFGVYGVGLAVDQVPMFPLQDLRRFLGSQWAFNPLSVEFVSPWWANGKLIGRQFPPIEGEALESEVFICWGANTYVSHNVGNARLVIRDAAENPNRMFIAVDPCLSETARMAQMHIMPKNGSDALLLRAIIAIIVQNGWEDREFIENYTSGWDQGKKWFEDFDVDEALEVCQVPKDQIMKFIRILCTKKWGVHADLGLFFGRHATLSCYLLDVLITITGNLFKLGTNVVAHNYLSWGDYTDENTPGLWRTWKTNSFPTVSFYGGGTLQECMEDPNEQNRLRALFVEAGNPARTFPDSKRLEEEFKNLDLMVVIDIAMTETCKCADYVLPGTTGYERFGTTVFTGGYPFSTLTFKQQLLEKEAERRDDSEILVDIIEACGFLPEIPEYLYEIAKDGVTKNDRMAIIEPVNKYLKEIGREDCRKVVLYKVMGKAMGSMSKAVFWTNFIYGELKMEAAMMVGYTFPHVHLELENNPEFAPLVIRDQVFFAIDNSPSGNVIAGSVPTIEAAIEEQVLHPDKKVHLFDETVDQFIKEITSEKEKEILYNNEFPYLISAGRHADEAGVNTIMRNPETYKYRQPYTFMINPEDAKDMNLEDEQWVRVTTKVGSIKVPVEYSYRAAKGYGIITHHFGLADEEGRVYGEAINKLTSGEDVDEIAGDAIYRYVPCRVDALEEGEAYGLWNYEK